MCPDIQTIFFDVGNTLRIVQKDQAFIDQAEADLMELIQTKESHDALFAKLESRWKTYRRQSKETLLDVSEGELWTQYMLPDYDANMIFANAPRLTRLWRDHDGRRVARPDAVATLRELCARGYILGIIANTVTETEIPDWMAADKVAQARNVFDALRAFDGTDVTAIWSQCPDEGGIGLAISNRLNKAAGFHIIDLT